MNQKATTLIIVGIAAIMLFTINCSGSSPSDTPPIPEPEICECTDKEHLGIGETCCDREDCTCTLRVYGSITDNNGNVINIYREGTVSETDMTKAASDIQAGYASLGLVSKGHFATKGVNEIHVTPSTNNVEDGVISVDLLGAEYFATFLSSFGLLSSHNMKNVIRLAAVPAQDTQRCQQKCLM